MADPTPPADFWVAIIGAVAAISAFLGALLMRIMPAVLMGSTNGKDKPNGKDLYVTEKTCHAINNSINARLGRLEKQFDDNSAEVKNEFRCLNEKVDHIPDRIMEQIRVWGKRTE